MKKALVIITGIVSLIYLLNPSAGVFEIIPDVIPVIGNLDEATATTLFLASLSYFGIDLTNIFKKKNKEVDKNKSGE